ncbi:MAG TPA: metalloregulator ArsR/SmtB family transcription factor [Gemmatimonadales bacterium]|nr:metalloregulator ArsR/SmtB family transcription factor [Gemmatimonadales bacterium]
MPAPATPLDPALLDQAASVIKCLGHPLRLMLLDAIETGAATVTELQARTGASQAMVSQQLATLRGHGIVTARREGPFVRYSIAEPKVHSILDCIRGCGA